jgi:hypothetical protein
MASQQLCTCVNSLTHLLLAHPTLPLLGLQPYRSALQQLLLTSAQQLQLFDHRGLSVLLHAAAAIARAPLGLAPNQGFMKQWYKRSRAVMQQASPLDLAMAGWALGRLGAYPPSQWAAEFLVHSKVRLLPCWLGCVGWMMVAVALRQTCSNGMCMCAASADVPHIQEHGNIVFVDSRHLVTPTCTSSNCQRACCVLPACCCAGCHAPPGTTRAAAAAAGCSMH